MTSRFERLIGIGLVALPPIALLVNAATWVRLGVDFPIQDDWRAYMLGKAGSFDLEYLLRQENDTLYPVGKVLDGIAQVVLGGNEVVYQLLSMLVVLGLLLALQGWLLRRTAGATLVAAASFCLAITSVRAWTYWGHANLGYHQAVPLVCLLAIAAVIVAGRGSRALVASICALLGLVAGFAYISGAVAVLAVALAAVVLSRLVDGPLRERLTWAALGLLPVGVLATVAQWLAVIVLRTGSRPALALPGDLDYWRYVLGMIADAAYLPVPRPDIAFPAVLVLVALLAGTAVLLMTRLARRQSPPHERLGAVVYLLLLAGVGAYLLLVASGRLELSRATHAPGTDAFLLGFDRFYEWWVSALWPWLLVVGVALAASSRRVGHRGRSVLATGAAVLAIVVVARGIDTGSLGFEGNYTVVAFERTAEARCIEEALMDGAPTDCGYPNWTGSELARATLYAHRIGASFTRGLRPPVSSDERDVLFRLSQRGGSALATGGPATVTPLPGPAGYRVHTEPGAYLRLETGMPERMAECAVLELTTDLTRDGSGWARTTWFPMTAPAAASLDLRTARPWTDIRTEQQWVPVDAAGGGTASFVLLAADGFQDEVWLIPGLGSSELDVSEVTLDCRRARG